MNDTPTLRAAGIVLRPLILPDAPALFIALGDAEAQRYRRQSAHADEAETARYIEDTLARSRNAWAITLDGGEALGRLALRLPQPDAGEFGIVIRRAAQGRGLGAAALRLAVAHAFGTLALSRLIADIDSENAASLALFRSAGFADHALLRGARLSAAGPRDSLILVKHRPL